MSDKTYIEGTESGKKAAAAKPVAANLSQIGATMEALFSTIEARKGSSVEGSYTKQLLDGKLDGLLKKVSEESLETCLAAKECEMLQRTLVEGIKATQLDDLDSEDVAGVMADDPDSSPITKTMQGFSESLLLSQALQECDQIRRTAQLLDEGVDHMRYEAADVIYHLLVLLARFDVPLEEVAAELNTRMREDERPAGCVMLHDNHVKRGK